MTVRSAGMAPALLLLCLLAAVPTHAAGPTPPPAPSSLYDAESAALPPGAVSVRPAGSATTVSDELDNYDDTPVTGIYDPLEPWNRFWFAFNDIFYVHIAKPVFEAYQKVMPRQIREGVSNIWDNVGFPKRFINNLLQGKGKGAFVELGRFCTNISAGFGVMDVAAGKKVLVPYDPSGEDFGQTLGRWGIGHGVYIVWPFLGPSSLRESVGFAGDCVVDPFFYVYPWELSTVSELYLRFNDLEGTLSTYTSLRGIAVDPYIAVREAYISYRNQQVLR